MTTPSSDGGDFQRAKAAAEKLKASRNLHSVPQPVAPAAAEPEAIETCAGAVFPVDVLPPAVATWARAYAVFAQVPITMPATFALQAMMTAAIRHDVCLKGRWTQPLISQMLLVAPPGSKKSPVWNPAFAPIYKWQRANAKAHQEAADKIQRSIDELMSDGNGRSTPVMNGTPEHAELAKLKAQLKNLPEPERRLIKNVTPEMLAHLLDENDGVQVLASSEGDVFENFLGRYSDSAQLDPILEGFDGGHFDRLRLGASGGKKKDQTRITIDSIRVGVSCATQHGVLRGLLANRSFVDKGAADRLLYVVLPEKRWRSNLHPAEPRPGVTEDYEAVITGLLTRWDNLEPHELQNGLPLENGWREPAWFTAVRERCEWDALGEFVGLEGWASKFPSNISRIACVLELAGGGGEAELAELADFFVAHAKRALASREQTSTGTVQDELVSFYAKLCTKFLPVLGAVPAAGESAPRTSREFKGTECRSMSRAFRGPEGLSRILALLDQLLASGHVLELENDSARSLGNKLAARKFVVVHSATQGAPPPPDPSEDPDQPGTQQPYPRATAAHEALVDDLCDGFDDPGKPAASEKKPVQRAFDLSAVKFEEIAMDRPPTQADDDQGGDPEDLSTWPAEPVGGYELDSNGDIVDAEGSPDDSGLRWTQTTPAESVADYLSRQK